jgi:hypothetical protein
MKGGAEDLAAACHTLVRQQSAGRAGKKKWVARRTNCRIWLKNPRGPALSGSKSTKSVAYRIAPAILPLSRSKLDKANRL